jgi:hypothetical protein
VISPTDQEPQIKKKKNFDVLTSSKSQQTQPAICRAKKPQNPEANKEKQIIKHIRYKANMCNNHHKSKNQTETHVKSPQTPGTSCDFPHRSRTTNQ